MRRTASDWVENFPLLSKTMVFKFNSSGWFWKTIFACSDCREAYWSFLFLSCRVKNRTHPLQRLQTPSKYTVFMIFRSCLWSCVLFAHAFLPKCKHASTIVLPPSSMPHCSSCENHWDTAVLSLVFLPSFCDSNKVTPQTHPSASDFFIYLSKFIKQLLAFYLTASIYKNKPVNLIQNFS